MRAGTAMVGWVASGTITAPGTVLISKIPRQSQPRLQTEVHEACSLVALRGLDLIRETLADRKNKEV